MKKFDFRDIKKGQGIRAAYKKIDVSKSDLIHFKEVATDYLNNLDDAKGRDEEHFKGYLKEFLEKSFYSKENRKVQTAGIKGKIDLAIYSGSSVKSDVDVIIEVKEPSESSAMMTQATPNVKSLQQAVFYYIREKESGNDSIKNIIVTNNFEFFVFDVIDIDRVFFKTKSLQKTYREWKGKRKTSDSTKFMYKKIGEFIEKSDATLKCIHVDLREFKEVLKAPLSDDENNELIWLYKLFSPEHLVKKQFANDSNTLDKGFYNELLHILGLKEDNKSGLIARLPKEERESGSLIESTMNVLKYGQHMNEVRHAKTQYGSSEEDQLFGIALELVITWMNRVLFLKLMEAQLLSYHNNDQQFKFLSYNTIDEYDELNKLFFWVLALRPSERSEAVQSKFGHIPYLNSSLFDSTELEKATIQISGLDDKSELGLWHKSILKKGPEETNSSLNTLEYLLRFLDAFNFSAETSGKVQSNNKRLINASVLGLIFEKINGYKDGSFFTPGFITEYMARETLRKAVVEKFNEAKDWEFEDFDDELFRGKLADVSRKEANEIINSVTVCDPAVGSGHFLVSCLNELISIKSELKILLDADGKPIRDLKIEVDNDELAVEYLYDLFEYKVRHEWKHGKVVRKPVGPDTQRLQETLFQEKKHLIENCLFGVDINPNSVKICRLRLWIELLKHTYYRTDTDYSELEVLPNIDINIKQGNSLVSRFGLDEDLSSIFEKSDHSLEDYKEAVRNYRETKDRSEKQRLQKLINDIKAEYSENLINNKPINKKLSTARGKLELMKNEDLFGEGKATKKELKKQENKVAKLEEQKAEEEAGAIFRQAFEWRFEFPEILDEKGIFKGFDVLIGNPPYDVLEKNRNEPLKPYADLRIYLEKTGRYSGVEGGKLNIYRLFIQLFIELSKKNARLSFITQLSLLADTSVSNTRNYLFEKSSEILFDCFPQKDDPKKRVFEEAKVSTVITQAKITESNDSTAACKIFPFNSFKDDHKKFEFKFSDLKLLDEKNLPIPLVSEFEFNLLKKLYAREEVAKFRDIQQIKTRRGEINQTTYKKYITSNSNHKKLLKGAEIAQYMLRKKMSQGEFKWFNEDLFLKESNPKDVINHKRIGLQRITGVDERLRLVGTIVGKNIYFADSTNSVHLEGETSLTLEFLLGLLNSKLYQWRFKLTSTNNNVGTNEIDVLPILDFSISQQNKIRIDITSNANQILTTKQENPEADTSKLEAEIDQLVYELYGLTDEEIAVVEESFN